MFNWKAFIDEADVLLDADNKVDYLCYKGIEIHPYGHGTNLVGAYKYSYETKRDRRHIAFFERNGMMICNIIKAMEFGLSDRREEAKELYTEAPTAEVESILRFAFKKAWIRKDAI